MTPLKALTNSELKELPTQHNHSPMRNLKDQQRIHLKQLTQHRTQDTDPRHWTKTLNQDTDSRHCSQHRLKTLTQNTDPTNWPKTLTQDTNARHWLKTLTSYTAPRQWHKTLIQDTDSRHWHKTINQSNNSRKCVQQQKTMNWIENINQLLNYYLKHTKKRHERHVKHEHTKLNQRTNSKNGRKQLKKFTKELNHKWT